MPNSKDTKSMEYWIWAAEVWKKNAERNAQKAADKAA